jgi:hypothetical protein
MATNPTKQTPTGAAGAEADQPTPPPSDAGDAAQDRIAELEAENQRLREQAEAAAESKGEPRLTWVVAYPEISAQPKDTDGKPVGEPIVLKAGQTLPAECEWNAPFLRSIGHVHALSVKG